MIKSTRTAAMTVLMLLLFLLPVTSIYADGNLLQNPGFEEGGEDAPSNWTKDMWISGDNSGILSIQSDGFTPVVKRQSLRISNPII